MLVFAICLGVALVVGAIVTATYVGVENKKNPDNPVSTTTIVFMMGSFVLLGLLAYAIYYFVVHASTKGIPASEVLLTKKDIKNVESAKKTLKDFNDTVNKLPEIIVKETCNAPDVCYGGAKPTAPTGQFNPPPNPYRRNFEDW